MNVTLGIPRLQEILMAASQDIQNPFMTCPPGPNKSMKDVICIADKLKKITVADIIENLKVSCIADNPIYRTYKLTMKLYEPKDYRKYTDVTVEDWEETLKVVSVRKLEDAIEKHVRLLSKTSDIKNFVDQTIIRMTIVVALKTQRGMKILV